MSKAGTVKHKRGSTAEHVPRMSPEATQRIRQWHEGAYEELRQRETSEIQYLGRTFIVPPQVFPPTPMSDLLGNALLDEVRPSDRVLDMGTGCGVNAILAASASRDVVAVDINPHALECARKNTELNGVSERIEIYESNLFDEVDGSFDLIVFDPPFRWFEPRDILEAAITDRNYESLTRFMEKARGHLRQEGRILLFFGSSADLGYLEELIEREDFFRESVAERRLDKGGLIVSYFVFRLKP